MTGPSFLVIGAQKAGTTWLYEMLRLHPQVGLPHQASGPFKEVHFWDNPRRRARGLQWYFNRFRGDKSAYGDMTPAYAVLPVSTIREIAALNPGMRLIYTLRNPIERSWSAAGMLASRRPNGPERAMLLESDSPVHEKSEYASSLSKWLSVFPRSSLLVRRFEEITGDPRAYLRACASHIGVDPSFYDTVPDGTLSQSIHAASDPAMPDRATYERLRELYRPGIRDLEQMLGWDLSSWLASYDEWRAVSRGRLQPTELS